MGGSAFPSYNTPRLSHAEYYALRERITALLSGFYAKIVCPPEAPSKLTHGDLDLLVCTPLSEFTSQTLASALGAVAATKPSTTTSYCVPLAAAAHAPCSAAAEGGAAAAPPARFAQVDLLLVAAEPALPWTLFTRSYGDMQQILGLLQRPLGLTSNDVGLHVRVPEIERAGNRKAAMLLLSGDVGCMLEFLGLDEEAVRRGFGSDDEVFEWCLRGRFWGEGVVAALLEERSGERNGAMHAGDRERLRKRDMFRRFVDEFLPSHQELWKGKESWSREQVLREALRVFPVCETYDVMMHGHNALEKEKAFVKEIRSVVPEEGERLDRVMRGLKRCVDWTDGRPVMLDNEREIGQRTQWLAQVRDEEKHMLLAWIKKNYVELQRREQARAQQMKRNRQAVSSAS